jgi:Tol biopolymer transport system component
MGVKVALSRDGKRVAYAAGGLFVINVDGSGWKRLTPNACDHAPTGSPDGTRIAFVRCYHLYVMRADGKRPRRLPHAPAPVGRPSWRSGGRIFLAAAAIPGASQLVEVGAGDGHVKRRLRFEVLARPDGISPDGTRLIYPSRGVFYVRTVATGTVTPMTGLPSSLVVSGPVAWQSR